MALRKSTCQRMERKPEWQAETRTSYRAMGTQGKATTTPTTANQNLQVRQDKR